MELQAALQASLTGGEFGFAWDNETGPTHAPVPAPELRQAPLPPGFPPQGPEVEESDLVAASMARNRAMLERVRREQEAALRETYEAEVVAGFPTARAGPGPDHNEEDEELRRALVASMEDVEEQGDGGPPMLVDDNEDEDEDGDSEKENIGVRAPPPPRPLVASDPGSPNIAVASDRVYDDEDQAFQAAIRASLESVPAGFVTPATPLHPSQQSLPYNRSVVASQPAPASTGSTNKDDDGYEPEEASSPAPAPSEPLSMEEIRRRRLAKFGG